MTDAERIARVQLARTKGVGPLTYSRFLETYGSGLAALEAFPERVRASGRGELKLYPADKVRREFDETDHIGARIILSGDEDYPELLGHLSPAPPVITVWGNTDLLKKPCVALVGSRNASAAAMRIAHDMAHDLGNGGYTVVSGLARGVDTASHNGSLSTGTVAVIAGGIDNIYPAQNENLRNQIKDTGLVVSESPFGHEPRANDFPRRNRLITGLSLGVVVIEAAQRSGSLISARTALEQGREVMAVPGSPLDNRNRGSNGLIRSGAILVENAEQVMEAIAPAAPSQPSLFEMPDDDLDDETLEFSDEDRARIIQALSPTATTIADISLATGIPSRKCAILLVELELEGIAGSLPGGLVRRQN